VKEQTGLDPVQAGDGTEAQHESTPWSSRWRDAPDSIEVALPHVAPVGLPRLIRAIEDEVIPRLVLSGRAVKPVVHPGVSPAAAVVGDCIAEFVALLLRGDTELAHRYIDTVQVRGASRESIYLELMAPAARVLGRMWEEDLCTFSDVTLALCRLHDILRQMSIPQEQEATPSGRRLLLTPVPGEQHTFGLLMVADCFRRGGWDVRVETSMSSAELLTLVRHEWFTIVGLSVACDAHLDGVASALNAMRKSSRNKALGVMVGGPVFTLQPELAIKVGADATARDGHQAVLQAESLVRMFARRC
jgi:methanogenic corrinoid protein MtbC1